MKSVYRREIVAAPYPFLAFLLARANLARNMSSVRVHFSGKYSGKIQAGMVAGCPEDSTLIGQKRKFFQPVVKWDQTCVSPIGLGLIRVF